MDGFLMAPGEETTVAAIPAAKWADLSPEGKVAASKLAAENIRTEREAQKTERIRQSKLRREARAAAKAELPPLTDRAKSAVKTAANTVAKQTSDTVRGARTATSRAASTAWSEAKTKSLEFRADPTGSALSAVTATVDAARKASYATVEGVAKTREVAARAKGLTRTQTGRAVTKSVAAAAGYGIAAMGNPVLGAAMVTVAAGRGAAQVRERFAARQQTKQTQLNEIIAARATARKMPAPRTSIVSDAAPVQAPVGF